MTEQRTLRWGVCAFVLTLCASAQGVTVRIDYTRDWTNYFGAGNPHGVASGGEAKDALDAAALYFSQILDDSLNAFSVPARYNGSVGGYVDYFINFTDPSTGASTDLTSHSFGQDEYIIYAGARDLSGSTVGIGGPGGRGFVSDGGFYSWEIDEINTIEEQFFSDVDTRGQATGYANWGGAIAFDNQSSTNWHYDHNSTPAWNEIDFYTVALHELAHALGFGINFPPGANETTEWQDLVVGGNFTGAQSAALYGAPVPLASGYGHWAQGIDSPVLGGAAMQETLMAPSLTTGNRQTLTQLDAAGLTDIGWTVIDPPGLDGDFNGDGVVDAADYTTWRNNPTVYTSADYQLWRENFGGTSGALAPSLLAPSSEIVPEPSTLAIALLFGMAFLPTRLRRP